MRWSARRIGWASSALLALLCLSTVCHAQSMHLRTPQVSVQGNGLQDLFTSLAMNVNVTRGQVDGELLQKVRQTQSIGGGPGPRLSLLLELVRSAPETSLGLYAGHEPVPELVEVFPSGWRTDGFATVAFRPDPERMIITLFDENAVLLATRTIPGGDTLGVGFYLSGPGGTFFSQDARNPGGRPQALFYLSSPWLDWLVAWEDRAADSASDRDYDDAVLLVTYLSEGPYTTDVRRTTWGSLKARFR